MSYSVIDGLVYLFRHRISESELLRPTAVKPCHVINIWMRFIMQVRKFGAPLIKISGPKTCKIWADFTQLPTLIANVSGMRPDIQNRKDMLSRTIPPAFSETSPVNFGPLSIK